MNIKGWSVKYKKLKEIATSKQHIEIVDNNTRSNRMIRYNKYNTIITTFAQFNHTLKNTTQQIKYYNKFHLA